MGLWPPRSGTFGGNVNRPSARGYTGICPDIIGLWRLHIATFVGDKNGSLARGYIFQIAHFIGDINVTSARVYMGLCPRMDVPSAAESASLAGLKIIKFWCL